MLAGGVAYYYAKSDINDRRDRQHRERMGHTSGVAYQSNAGHQKHRQAGDSSGSPSNETLGNADPVQPGAEHRYRIGKRHAATEGRDRGDRL